MSDKNNKFKGYLDERYKYLGIRISMSQKLFYSLIRGNRSVERYELNWNFLKMIFVRYETLGIPRDGCNLFRGCRAAVFTERPIRGDGNTCCLGTCAALAGSGPPGPTLRKISGSGDDGDGVKKKKKKQTTPRLRLWWTPRTPSPRL